MQPNTEDRRKHKRYKLDNSVAVSPEGIFQINDLSKGGFCFRCPPFTYIPDSWETDILSSANILEGIPAKRTWVSMVENSGHEYLPMLVGIKFGKLTKKQETHLSQLLHAISHNGAGEE